jgi:hypothetical protein
MIIIPGQSGTYRHPRRRVDGLLADSGQMALQTYKITFKDGSTQTVTSLSPGTSGDWLVFGDGSGEVLRVPAKDVESVSREGTPDRERRAPRTAAV